MRELFNIKLLAALIAAGVLAFIAFLLLSAYSDEFRSGSDGRGHALSNSAIGFSGIVQLVDGVGGKASLLRSTASNDNDDLLVLVLDRTSSAKAMEELAYNRPNQPVLVILPKWLVMPDPQRRGWVQSLGHDHNSPALSAFGSMKVNVEQGGKGGALAKGVAELDRISVPAPRQAQTVSGEGITPLLEVPGKGALIARYKDFYILADPDLMNNYGLKDRRTARAALQILARLNSDHAQGVTFDVSLNGFGSKPSVYKIAFEPPFLALTLALFVAAILAGLHGAFRFGPEAHERRAIAFGKLALVENSAGLIQLARREHRAGGAYADVIREGAALASGAPPTLHGEALDSYLDSLSPKDGVRFSDLARQAQQAADRFDLLRAARALFQWKKEVIR